MQQLIESLVSITGAFAGLLLLIFVVLTILVPVSIYSAQKYARKCFLELEEIKVILRETREHDG